MNGQIATGRPESQRVSNGAMPGLYGWMVLILLLAAFLRIYGLAHLSPPGLEHDEVANWLIDRSILEGEHAIYFTAAYGHEAAYHYLQALFVLLLGDHALALRLPSLFSGLMLVAVGFSLARRLFGTQVAVIAAALLAVTFWPVFYSRLGLRAITLPLFSGMSILFWWQGWHRGAPTSPEGQLVAGGTARPLERDFIWAGLLAGLSIHTYMAARALPIFYGLFTLYLVWLHRDGVKRRLRGILLFWAIFGLVASPLIIYLWGNPGSEFRISEIDAPLRAMLQGDLRPVLQNSLKLIGMFGFAGDPLWRQNVAGAPVFDPIIATLFYVSIPLALIRFRDSRYGFLLLWLITSAIPSLVTIDAPSSIRISNILPVLTILPALVIHKLGQLSTVMHRLSTGCGRFCRRLGAGIALLYLIVLTGRALFTVWPQNEEVQFVWQAALTDAAAYLDSFADSGPVAIGGWTPSTMDPPTMLLSMRRDDLRLSFFNPENSLILPAVGERETARILHPTILALHPAFSRKLVGWQAAVQEMGQFVLYTLPATPVVAPGFPVEISLGGELRFLGYDLLAASGESVELITYWRVMVVPEGPRRLFVRLMDADGQLLVEGYSLDGADLRNQRHWQPGDTILQHHLLDPAETVEGVMDGLLTLRLGIYDPNSCPPLPCENLLAVDGAAFIEVPLVDDLEHGRGP